MNEEKRDQWQEEARKYATSIAESIRKKFSIIDEEESSMSNVNLSAPWEIMAKIIEKLFDRDPEVEVDYSEEEKTVVIRVFNNRSKYEAIEHIMPKHKQFGNVTLDIMVAPVADICTEREYFSKAFEGNPAFKCCECYKTPAGDSIDFAVFEKSVVQYFNDNIGDPHGITSTLYENIARDVFDNTYIKFCTEYER